MVIYVSMFTRFIPVLGIWKEIALRIQSLKITFFFLSNPEHTAKKSEQNSAQNQINQINTLLNKLGQQVTNEQVKKYRLTTILRSLESLISGNEACLNLQNS